MSGIGRASVLLGSGTLVSRLLGFASAIILAQTIGLVGSGADAFAIARGLPQSVYAIVAGGVLTAVLVPQIVRAATSSDGGQAFVNKIVTLGLLVFGGIALLVTLAAPLLVSLYAQEAAGPGERGFTQAELALATALAYWVLPQVLFLAAYALLGEVLNARKVFGPYTWTPVMNNLVMIGGLLIFGVLFDADTRDATAWTPEMVGVLGGASTLGIALQAIVLFAFWRRAGLRYRPDFQWRGVGLKQTGRAAGWVFGMILVTQISGIALTRVATLAGDGDPGNAVLGNAWLIFILPHSIIALSIGTAYFTRMSGHARDGDRQPLRDDLRDALTTIALFMTLASVGLLVVATPFARLFTDDQGVITGTAWVIAAYVVGLVPFSTLFMTQRTFYALDDTRTPFFIQLLQAGVFVLGAVLAAQLPGEWIAAGLALCTTVAGLVQTGVSLLILRRRLGGFGLRRVARRIAQYALAALPASAVGIGIAAALGAFTVEGFARSTEVAAVASMAIIGVPMTLVYLGALAVQRIPELQDAVAPLIRRLRGR